MQWNLGWLASLICSKYLILQRLSLPPSSRCDQSDGRREMSPACQICTPYQCCWLHEKTSLRQHATWSPISIAKCDVLFPGAAHMSRMISFCRGLSTWPHTIEGRFCSKARLEDKQSAPITGQPDAVAIISIATPLWQQKLVLIFHIIQQFHNTRSFLGRWQLFNCSRNSLLWNVKVQLSSWELTTVYISTACFPNIHFNIIHLFIGLPSKLFWDFPTNILFCHASKIPHPSHNWFKFCNSY